MMISVETCHVSSMDPTQPVPAEILPDTIFQDGLSREIRYEIGDDTANKANQMVTCNSSIAPVLDISLNSIY